MEFGRLNDVDGVDFRLPPDPPRNAEVLASGELPARLHLGTSGWSDKGFYGLLYPPGTRPAEALSVYARALDTIELNTTYYGADPERLARWGRAVREGFHFCPKLPATISHERELAGCEAEMEAFLAALDGLDGRLGRAWTILPPAFGPRRHAVLARFLESYAERVPLAVELRHADWFRDRRAWEDAMQLFTELAVVPVLTDVAGRRDVLHMRLCVPEAFVRFVGNGLHASDYTRLDAWSERLASWVDGGLERAYFFLHQKDEAHTVQLAAYLVPLLAERAGRSSEAWSESYAAHGKVRQNELF